MASTKYRLSKATTLIWLVILIPAVLYLTTVLYSLYVIGYVFTPHPITPDIKRRYKNYEAFAKRIMPPNFTLLQTTENEVSIDAGATVTQSYRISGTRRDVLNQLVPIFKRFHYAFTEADAGADIQDFQTFTASSLTSQADPVSMSLDFIPSDPDCGPAGENGCPAIPTVVKEVDITWQ